MIALGFEDRVLERPTRGVNVESLVKISHECLCRRVVYIPQAHEHPGHTAQVDRAGKANGALTMLKPQPALTSAQYHELSTAMGLAQELKRAEPTLSERDKTVS